MTILTTICKKYEYEILGMRSYFFELDPPPDYYIASEETLFNSQRGRPGNLFCNSYLWFGYAYLHDLVKYIFLRKKYHSVIFRKDWSYNYKVH